MIKFNFKTVILNSTSLLAKSLFFVMEEVNVFVYSIICYYLIQTTLS